MHSRYGFFLGRAWLLSWNVCDNLVLISFSYCIWGFDLLFRYFWLLFLMEMEKRVIMSAMSGLGFLAVYCIV